MTLSHAWVLHLLWLLPAAGFALIVQSRLKRKSLERVADAKLLLRLAPKARKGRQFFKGILLLGALATLIFSLAGPRWGSRYQEVSQKGVDIVVLVDVSPSMLVEDVKPSRLERARREIVDFLKVAAGDRIGLVAFSGLAFVQCPLTLDSAALEMFLSALQPDLIPVAGTDIGAGILSGLGAFDYKTETDRVMVLITDGEDNEGRGVEAARRAAEKGVRIFVFGIGEPTGGPIPAVDGKGGFKKDGQGGLILSKLDESGLERIASVSGGTYTRAVTGDMDLDRLYFDGIKERTQAQTVRTGKIKVHEERFAFFVLGAFLFLLLEGLLDENAEKRFGSKLLLIVSFSIYGALPFMFPDASLAAESPDELYRQGRFKEAEEAYARLDMENHKDVRYRFNRGCAAYRNGRLAEAAAAFSSALKRSEDQEMRFKAAYNQGMTAFKQGDFEAAADSFKKSIIYNPARDDARYNLELALKALEKLKKEQTETAAADSKEKPEQKEDPPGGAQDDKGVQGSDEVESDAAAKKERSAERPPENLSGELKALEDLPGMETKTEEQEAAPADIDKNKAEALLDNVKEERSRYLRFLMPRGKRQGLSSGKDW